MARVAVLTSGGDSCGMNASIRAILRGGLHHGLKMYVVNEGYKGLCTMEEHQGIVEVGWTFAGGVLDKGGTIIGSARCAEFREAAGRKRAAMTLIKRKIDCLIVVGGDGSLTGADIFRREWPGYLDEFVAEGLIDDATRTQCAAFTVIGLVGSIDNDMFGTDYTIGADSALARIMAATDAIASTAMSHQRTFVIEVMGRNCGYLALMTTLATGADWMLIPESPPREGWEDVMVQSLRLGHQQMGRRCLMVVVAEGAIDQKGQPITSQYVKKVLDAHGHDCRVTILGHVQRGGKPTCRDRNISTVMGMAAVEAVLDPEVKGRAIYIAVMGKKVIRQDLVECVAQTRAMAEVVKAGEYKKAVKLRGEEFEEAYQIVRRLIKIDSIPAPSDKGLRVGVMMVGAPSPGMNSTARMIIRLAIGASHRVIGIIDGIEGLLKNKTKDMQWNSVSGWTLLGGAALGTNRKMPTSAKMSTIVETLRELKLDVLVAVGGMEGYATLSGLQKYINSHAKDLDVALVCFPATISNNLPGTDWSVGCDSALNNIVDAVDKIKQSSVATHRVFVVEVMGAQCGYLTLQTSLANGAEFCHLPENGLCLNDLQRINDSMHVRNKLGKTVSLLVGCEGTNHTYTTHFISKILQEEAHGEYEVRQCILGHLQQGGSPTFFDRILGSRMAYAWVNSLAECQRPGMHKHSCMLGVVDGLVTLTPLDKFDELTDMTFRRPRKQWWRSLEEWNRILAQSYQGELADLAK